MSKTSFDLKRAFAITNKEFAHVFRDKFTLGVALGLPLVFVFIFGVAIESKMKDIPMAIVDQDHSQSSRQLVESFSGSSYFKTEPLLQISRSQQVLEREDVKAVVIIPPAFERDLLSNRRADVQILVNSADSQTGSSVINYVSQIQPRSMNRLLGIKSPSPIELKSRFLYNPELNTRWFTVPGLMVIILAIIAVLLTSLTIAREWEFGSMELLLSTPVRPLEIIVGKIIPYAVLCIVAMIMTYLSARFFFGVPFKGNPLTYSLAFVLFLVTYLAQGLLISIITRKQMLAMQVAMLTGLTPSMLLSGFLYPIENMPTFFRYLTALLPARWFMEISRASFLKGASLWQMKEPFLILTLTMVVFVVLALRSFKEDVEP
jgi:ABC-2 type transport system permease protein